MDSLAILSNKMQLLFLLKDKLIFKTGLQILMLLRLLIQDVVDALFIKDSTMLFREYKDMLEKMYKL
jgi:hypothetical protein